MLSCAVVACTDVTVEEVTAVTVFTIPCPVSYKNKHYKKEKKKAPCHPTMRKGSSLQMHSAILSIGNKAFLTLTPGLIFVHRNIPATATISENALIISKI